MFKAPGPHSTREFKTIDGLERALTALGAEIVEWKETERELRVKWEPGWQTYKARKAREDWIFEQQLGWDLVK